MPRRTGPFHATITRCSLTNSPAKNLAAIHPRLLAHPGRAGARRQRLVCFLRRATTQAILRRAPSGAERAVRRKRTLNRGYRFKLGVPIWLGAGALRPKIGPYPSLRGGWVATQQRIEGVVLTSVGLARRDAIAGRMAHPDVPAAGALARASWRGLRKPAMGQSREPRGKAFPGGRRWSCCAQDLSHSSDRPKRRAPSSSSLRGTTMGVRALHRRTCRCACCAAATEAHRSARG